MTWVQDERSTASAKDRPDSAGAHVRLRRVYKVHHVGDTGVVALAGVDLDTMAEACAVRKIPVYWYKSEDLESDLDTLNKMTS